ncbi:hypothetical protein [Wenjunlia tyrosinilytica]|uniref:hypothetical protein n=1 Tax=Wenjunlia tyrosinilytica TaxID=1544741 RepID=UPI001665A54E|nr:hypothetical protein [Wenjunlia tyrosinilytica]
MRKAVLISAAVLLLLEAVAIAAVNWVMGIVVDHQNMSLGGADPDLMSLGTWIAGGVFGLFLVAICVRLFLAAFRERALGRLGRALVITGIFVNAVVGMIAVGIIGWEVFAFAMVELGLLVLSLMVAGEDEAPVEPLDSSAPPGPAADAAA